MGLFDSLEWHWTSKHVPLLWSVGRHRRDDEEYYEDDDTTYDDSDYQWFADIFNASIIDVVISALIFLVSNYLLFFIITFGIHQGLFYWMIYEYKDGKTYFEPWEYYRNWALIKEEQGWFFLYEDLVGEPFPFTETDPVHFYDDGIDGASVWNMEVFATAMWIWVVIAIVLELLFVPLILYLLFSYQTEWKNYLSDGEY